MTILRLIAHASLLIHMGQDVENVAKNLYNHVEKFPSEAEFIQLVDDAGEFLAAGLIPLPDPLMKQFTDALAALKGALASKAA